MATNRRDPSEIFQKKKKRTSRKSENTNLLLTEREGRTGEYWPEVVTVRTERSEVRTKTTEGQYSLVRPEQARLVSSLLYGTPDSIMHFWWLALKKCSSSSSIFEISEKFQSL